MVNDGRELEKRPALQSLQMSLVPNGAGQLFAGIVLSPHSWFPSVKDEVKCSSHWKRTDLIQKDYGDCQALSS